MTFVRVNLCLTIVSLVGFALVLIAVSQFYLIPGHADSVLQRTVKFNESDFVSTDATDSEPFELASNVVVYAFAGIDRLWGAMQVREDPSRGGVYYVATFRGDILRVERMEDGLKVRTVLSLKSAKIGWMYSFAFHPQFGNGDPKLNRVFVFYRSHDDAKKRFYRVSAFTLTDEHPAEAMDEEVLIEQEIGHSEHLGGAIEFDNDGFLLIAVGDNGLHNGKSENSQKIDKSLLSGVLRIDVDCQGGSVSRRPRSYPVGAKKG